MLFCISLTLCSNLNVVCANDNSDVKEDKKVIVLDEKGNKVNIESLKKLTNYQQNTDFNAIDELLKQVDIDKNTDSNSQLNVLSSSLYGDAYPYKQVNTVDPRCYGYSLNTSLTFNPGDVGYYGGYFYNRPYTDENIRTYFNVNTIAECVLADCQRLYNRSSRIISGPTATIYSYERRIAIRTGIHDFNNNGIIEPNLSEADYHFMLQNSDGTWAEKHGQEASISVGNINPSTVNWNLGDYSNYYNSSTVYIAIN